MVRPLNEIIAALAASEEELQFHADRLRKGDLKGDTTGDEEEHLEDLGNLYKEGARACAVLRRYQEGRLARTQARAPREPVNRAVTHDGELEVVA